MAEWLGFRLATMIEQWGTLGHVPDATIVFLAVDLCELEEDSACCDTRGDTISGLNDDGTDAREQPERNGCGVSDGCGELIFSLGEADGVLLDGRVREDFEAANTVHCCVQPSLLCCCRLPPCGCGPMVMRGFSGNVRSSFGTEGCR